MKSLTLTTQRLIPALILALSWLSSGHAIASNFSLNATTLADNEQFIAQRGQRFFVVTLKRPHRVYSTSYINGGTQEALRYLVNHQSMEARGDDRRMMNILGQSRWEYHKAVAEQLQLQPDTMALMGTAANVHHLGHSRQVSQNLVVDAFVTAGVKGNARRAGDSANWYETENGNKPVDFQGTINILLLINQPLTPGAQLKASMLATEAKSAALAELAIPSTASSHLATGTGTDQLVIATLTDKNQYTLESASGHLKLGELIGRSVRLATLQSLRQQNQLDGTATATVFHALGRFGLTRDLLLQGLQQHLEREDFALAEHNLASLIHEPRLVAAAYAYASLLDRLQYQTLHHTLRAEVLRDQAAQAGVALAGRSQHWPMIWAALHHKPEGPLSLFIRAMAMGWQAKWHIDDQGNAGRSP